MVLAINGTNGSSLSFSVRRSFALALFLSLPFIPSFIFLTSCVHTHATYTCIKIWENTLTILSCNPFFGVLQRMHQLTRIDVEYGGIYLNTTIQYRMANCSCLKFLFSLLFFRQYSRQTIITRCAQEANGMGQRENFTDKVSQNTSVISIVIKRGIYAQNYWAKLVK